MDSLKIPLCHIYMFYMLGGTYETIETVKQERKYRIEKCKLHFGGKTYTGLVRYEKYSTAIVDILEDGRREDCCADFWETYDKLEKAIPREIIAFTVGKLLFYKYMVYTTRLMIIIGFLFYWYTGRANSVTEYIFSTSLVIAVFAFSRPLLLYSKKNL